MNFSKKRESRSEAEGRQGPYFHPPSSILHPPASVLLGCLMLAGLVSLTGCHLPGAGLLPSFSSAQKCALPPDLTKDQVVRHLNNNTNLVQSWRSTNVEISTAGMPVKLSAVIAVEEPRNFRLRAALMGGNQADLGSNPERFWFWMRRSPDKFVLTSSHEEAGRVQQMMKLPFQPDWLMEALGVIPLDGSEFTMLPAAEPEGVVSLISHRVTQAGEPVQRVIQVDMCRGYIIAHELYDARNRLIARAELNDYKLNRESGAALPHRVDLDWPQAGMALTMKIGAIEVNPAAIPQQTWQLPDIPGYPVLDLGRLAMQREPDSLSPGHARVSVAPGSSPFLDPATATGAAVHSTIEPDSASPGPRQTAEAPPWDDGPPTNRWRRPVEQPAHTIAQSAAEEPPWDDAPSEPDSMSPGRQHYRSTASRHASQNEEPPWDTADNERHPQEEEKPASVFDLLKAPFARFARRQ